MKHLGDICKINGAEIEPVWCITGGSPCQDLSIAGKRAGLAGARSGLFMEQVRIVKEMREADKRNGRTGDMVRPRYLVWENVVGAFSNNEGKDFAAVLEEIIKIVEPEAPGIEVPEKGWPTWGGYHDEVGGRWSVVWRTHDAQYWGKTIRDSRTGDVLRMGTPQRRRRISVVADFGGDTASEIQFDGESVSGDIAAGGTAGEGLAEAAEGSVNPAVARSLTARADGSPCADRGPNIVCSAYQGGCDGGGKGALVQTEKSGTLGCGNDQTIFAPIPINDKATRWQGGGESRNHDGSGNGLGVGKEGDPSSTLTAGDRHGVMCMNPWDSQSARVYDKDGVWHSLNANENGGMARDSVLCAGFKLGNSEQARSIGYQEELSPTLNAECGGNKPAVVIFAVNQREEMRDIGEKSVALVAEPGMHCQTFVAQAYSFDSLSSNSMKSKNPNSGCREVDVAKTLDCTDPAPNKNQGGIAIVAMTCLDMSHACDVIRDCGEQVPALQARMGTGGNQVPLVYGIGNGQAAEASIMAEEIAQTLNTMHDAQAVMCGAVDCRNGKESDVGGTLQARTGHTLNANGVVRQNMVVRRLTPLECERLQGFPDKWTDIGDWTDEKSRKHKAADSPRYKALGNSIALPFWEWMLRRMARYLPEGATLGSLFDGISGFNVCWARIHGAHCCRWSSEIEQFPIAVVKKHFGDEETGEEGDFEKFSESPAWW